MAEVTVSREELEELICRYAAFNGARSLGTVEESEFRVVEKEGLLVLLDPARAGGMCNHVLGFTTNHLAHLPMLAEEFTLAGTGLQIDLDKRDSTPELERALADIGLAPCWHLNYLTRAPGRQDGNEIVVERWQEDRVDDFLSLLKTSGIDCSGEVWEKRRRHYCSEVFRTFVAMVQGVPRAWATCYRAGRFGYFANAYTQEAFRTMGVRVPWWRRDWMMRRIWMLS